MKVGDTKTLTLPPEQAYGPYNEDLKEKVEKEKLASFQEAGFKLEPGEKIPTQQFGTLTIVDADDDTVTIDMNHELAGKTLIFDVEVVDVQ